jgi:flagellin
MKINNNVAANKAYKNNISNNINLAKNQEKLASGKKINRAGDDAAGLAISEKMLAQISGLAMGSKNVQDASSLIRTAEGALSGSHDILGRMNELALQASNSMMGDQERAYLDDEFQQLKAELGDIATTTDFNGTKVLDGSFSASGGTPMTVQAGANEGDEITVSIEKSDAEALGLAASGVATADAARSAIGEVAAAVNSVSTQRASLGATQNQLEKKAANLDISVENLQSAQSRIRDTDMALQMTKLAKDRILQQASTSVLAQANMKPQNVLTLLGA